MSFDIEKLREKLNPSDALELMGTFRLRRLAKDEIYNPPGEVFRKVFYVVKGMLRSYVVTDNGEEKTLFFRWEGHFGGAYESLLRNEPTKLIFRAIEKCHLLEADYDALDKLSDKHPQLMKMRLNSNLHSMEIMMQKIESFVLDKPIDRYLNLVETKPEIVNRVPDKYIASFIGVTPVSLSRIRKRLAETKR